MTSSRVQIGRRAVLGSLAASGLLLAGCSTKGGASGARSSAKTRGGTLRHAPGVFNSVTDSDPHSAASAMSVKMACFDGLITENHESGLKLGLAEEFSPDSNDMTRWVIRVRDGVEFHNGKTLGADDVMYTIRRILDPKNPKAAATLLAPIDTSRMTKVDKRTVRLELKYPDSQLRQAFTPDFSSIVPTGFDPKHPVGTGPFSYVRFVPRQQWSGKANRNYWDDGPYLDALELVGFADSSAKLNALLSGQIDSVDHLLPSQLQQVQARKNLILVESQTGAIQQIGLNCRKGQDFEDPRVRKAFKLMMDREKLVRTVYGGHGEVGNDVGVFHRFDPACASDLHPHQDLERARSLLKAAGRDGMKTSIRVGDQVPGMTAAAELLVQQAKKVGVTIKLDIVQDLASLYSKAYYTAQMQSDQTTTLSMFGGATYYWLSTSDYNSGGYSNKKVDRLFKKSLSEDQPAYEKTMQSVSKIICDEGPWLVWGRQNMMDVYSDKFTGIHKDANASGINGCRFNEIRLA